MVLKYEGYEFTKLNADTKQAKRFLTMYSWATDKDIYDAYKQPSQTKVSTFYSLKRKMEELGGYDMRITGAGSDNYSCAFRLKIDDVVYLVYETKCNSYLIKWYD